jgi:predicted kinase
LHQLAERVLAAGYSVIVDATFLYRSDRDCFQQLAEKYGTTATILSFQVDQETLRTRIAKRKAEGEDPSDADLSVLEKQLKLVEPLSPDELARTVQVLS